LWPILLVWTPDMYRLILAATILKDENLECRNPFEVFFSRIKEPIIRLFYAQISVKCCDEPPERMYF
jgi:hypothetical protein